MILAILFTTYNLLDKYLEINSTLSANAIISERECKLKKKFKEIRAYIWL